MLSSVLFVLFLGLSSAAGGPCRLDWEQFGESCYGFGEEALSWSEAQEMCRSVGARLVEIETSAENEFLKNQARQKGRDYWLGATDIFHEGTWVWVSSGNLLHPFSDWHPGQPDNAQGGHEDCLDLHSAYNYQWNDNRCTIELLFICEAPLEEAVVGTTGPQVWVTTGSLLHPFDDWASGQPDNAQGGHEDCLELAWRNDYQWNDNVCDAKRNFICEAAAEVDGAVVG